MKPTPFGIYLRDKLISLRFGGEKYFYGCSEAELKKLQDVQKVDFLPETYRQFLLVMGHSCGTFWQGSDILYVHALHLKDAAKADLEWMESPVRIPDDAFVFLGHHGYIFYYFHTNNRDDDPPVYSVYEGEEPEKINNRLSEFYEQSIIDFGHPPANSEPRNVFEKTPTLQNPIQPNWNEYFRKDTGQDTSFRSKLSLNLRTILLKLGFPHQKR